MDSYEKKYNELVGKIEKAYLYAQTDSTKAVLEEIRPELKESEDEKVKKIITLCLEECVHSDIIRDYEKDDALAWLEKQVPKPKWTEEDEGMMKSIMVDIKYARRCHECDAHYNVELDWLESLKQRLGGEK